VEIKTVIVHSFRMGDVEDPDLIAAQPLYDWQTSEEGTWVMDHAVDQPEWHRLQNLSIMGWNYVIKAKLTAKDYTFWALKWGSNKPQTML
jgi:hypothetical protein